MRRVLGFPRQIASCIGRTPKLLPLMGMIGLGCSSTADTEDMAFYARRSDAVSRPSNIPIPKLAFGAPDNGVPGNEDVRVIDDWILSEFDPGRHGQKVKQALGANKVPLVFFYISAKSSGLQDCNVGAPPEQTLCHGGAQYIRSNADRLANIYADSARKYSEALGGKPGLIHVEPDWFQYVGSEQTSPLSMAEAGQIMNRLLTAVKQSCASCAIVADISPWNPDLRGWYSSWDLSKVSYGGLVGKRFPPAGSDGKSYADMANAIGKPLVVVDVYGPGGPQLGYNFEWDDLNNLDKARNDGVAVLVQPADNNQHFKEIINSYRSSRPAELPNPSATPSNPQNPGPTTPTSPSTDTGNRPSTDTGNQVPSGSQSPSQTSPTTQTGNGGKPPSPPANTPPSPAPAPAPANWQFEVSPNVNNYWIEVRVVAPNGIQITKVEAIIDNSWWVDMYRQSWGTYGVNAYVGRGSKVVFRAWDQNGNSHDSAPRTW